MKQKVVTIFGATISCIVVMATALTLIPSDVKSVFAMDNSNEAAAEVEINGDELGAFAAQYDTGVYLQGDEATAHELKVNDILLNTDLSAKEKNQYLAKMGVYAYSQEDEVELASSEVDDVKLNKPTIYYDAMRNEYIISGTGAWKNHNYKSELPNATWSTPKVGSTRNVGGMDAVGISLTNTSGNTNGLAIKSGYAQFYNGSFVKTASTLASENDCHGGGYIFQDQIKYLSVDSYLVWYDYTFIYNAYNMNCFIRYNAKLANYSGSAKLFYGHTWDKTEVSGIGLGEWSADISWTKTSDHWTAYSYARVFSKGKATN